MLELLIAPISKLLDKFIPDADEKAKLAHEIATMAQKQAHESAMAQVEVNKQEAQHRSIFVAGARPFILWVCGFAFAYHFIIQPIIITASKLYGIEIEYPEFDMTSLMTVLGGILGLGGLRSYEKKHGVSREKM
jgi:hypothetical protein